MALSRESTEEYSLEPMQPYRMPKAVAPHVSLLIPHLGGKAYALRSAIVSAVGQLIQNGYSDDSTDEADAQGSPISSDSWGAKYCM